MRTFYTESDIDDLVANGIRQLELGASVFLTDAARERAEELGVALIVPGEAKPDKALALPVPAKSEPLSSRPRGCQHGPLNLKNNQVETIKSGGPIVDQLIEAVSALKKRGG